MMGSPSLACLVLVFAVLQVQSYTLRDAFRDRELNRLQDYDKRQYSNQPSDEQMLRALSRMREFHLRKLMDENEGKLEGSEECKDVHADCHLIGENHCKEEEDEHIKTFVKTYCRATCNVDNCNPKGNIKPPHQPQPTCENQLSNQECEVYEGWGLCTSDYLIKGYMFKYCDLTCNKLLGKCQEKRWS